MNVLRPGRPGQLSERSAELLGVSFRDAILPLVLESQFCLLKVQTDDSLRSPGLFVRLEELQKRSSARALGHLGGEKLAEILSLLRRSAFRKIKKKPNPKPLCGHVGRFDRTMLRSSESPRCLIAIVRVVKRT
jgi:hypothetical protein